MAGGHGGPGLDLRPLLSTAAGPKLCPVLRCATTQPSTSTVTTDSDDRESTVIAWQTGGIVMPRPQIKIKHSTGHATHVYRWIAAKPKSRSKILTMHTPWIHRGFRLNHQVEESHDGLLRHADGCDRRSWPCPEVDLIFTP